MGGPGHRAARLALRAQPQPALPEPTFLELYSSQRFWWKSRYRLPATDASRKLTKQYPRLHLLRKSMGR